MKFEYLDEYIVATNSHDFNKVRQLLSDNVVYYFNDATLSSIDDIEAYFNKAWDMLPDEVYSAHNVQILQQTTDTLVYIYEYNYKGHYNGQYFEGKGRATNVFAKENGTYKLVHEHLSPWVY